MNLRNLQKSRTQLKVMTMDYIHIYDREYAEGQGPDYDYSRSLWVKVYPVIMFVKHMSRNAGSGSCLCYDDFLFFKDLALRAHFGTPVFLTDQVNDLLWRYELKLKRFLNEKGWRYD